MFVAASHAMPVQRNQDNGIRKQVNDMADPIATRSTQPLPSPSAEQLASSAAGSAAPAASAAAHTAARQAPVADVGSAARSLAAEAPVNTDKVQEIRAALRSGNYPIEPYTIAESMIRSLRG